MKKYLIGTSVALLLTPLAAFAAFNDVTLTTDTVLTVNSVTLNVSGSSAVIESAVVNAGTVVFTLLAGSSLEVTAPNREVLSADTTTGQVTNVCTSSESKLGYTGAVTVTITPQSTLCASASGGSGGGGGGGGGSSIVTQTTTTKATTTAATTTATTKTTTTTTSTPEQAALQSQLNTLQNQLLGLQQAGTIFISDLEIGATGDDVRALQVFLNANGFLISESGPGSPGNETTRFGGLTRAALAKFQAANGITPALGYFGPKTRALILGM